MTLANTLPRNVYSILKDFVKKVNNFEYVTNIMLFGSYSKGNYNKKSDLDIAVFVNSNALDLCLIYKDIARVSMQYDIDIQPQVFYNSELDNPMGIVEEIVEFGKDITNI